jgi:hypothetical protein
MKSEEFGVKDVTHGGSLYVMIALSLECAPKQSAW